MSQKSAVKTSDASLVDQWRAIQGTYHRTASAIDRELDSRFGIALSEFETLDLVADIDESATCRMKDLGLVSPMTQSALSRVVDRLEKAGLVERKACEDDRRSLIVGLTPAGRKLHAEASVAHRSLLKEHLSADS